MNDLLFSKQNNELFTLNEYYMPTLYNSNNGILIEKEYLRKDIEKLENRLNMLKSLFNIFEAFGEVTILDEDIVNMSKGSFTLDDFKSETFFCHKNGEKKRLMKIDIINLVLNDLTIIHETSYDRRRTNLLRNWF